MELGTDWHRIGNASKLDWHAIDSIRLVTIGTGQASDWRSIGLTQDWHLMDGHLIGVRLAMDWIDIGLAMNWHPIENGSAYCPGFSLAWQICFGLAMDWNGIGTSSATDWYRIGRKNLPRTDVRWAGSTTDWR